MRESARTPRLLGPKVLEPGNRTHRWVNPHHRDALAPGVANHVGRAAGTGRLGTVPHRHDKVGGVDHHPRQRDIAIPRLRDTVQGGDLGGLRAESVELVPQIGGCEVVAIGRRVEGEHGMELPRRVV